MPPWKPANRRAARVRAGPCHRGQNASSQPNAQSEHRGRHRLQQGGVLQQGGAPRGTPPGVAEEQLERGEVAGPRGAVLVQRVEGIDERDLQQEGRRGAPPVTMRGDAVPFASWHRPTSSPRAAVTSTRTAAAGKVSSPPLRTAGFRACSDISRAHEGMVTQRVRQPAASSRATIPSTANSRPYPSAPSNIRCGTRFRTCSSSRERGRTPSSV